MPIHNGGRWLRETLSCAASADCSGIEFLLIDSSDDDTSAHISADFQPALNIRYQRRIDLKPWTAKTNLAVRQASAPNLTMLHQDDLWLDDHVSALRTSIAAAPEAVMHVAASQIIDANGKQIGRWSLPFAPGIWPGDAFGRRLIVQNFLAVPSAVIRRDAWESVAGLDCSLWYTADWDLYLKLAKLGDVVVRPQGTTAFRVHGSSLTMTGSLDADAFREQHEIVLQSHGASFGLNHDHRLRARAFASAEMNCDLASAATGRGRSAWRAVLRLFSLGPINALRYLHESRLADRVLPRVRARLAGVL